MHWHSPLGNPHKCEWASSWGGFKIRRFRLQFVFVLKTGQLIPVLNDIASTMFNKKFIHEIFLKHTPLYSKKVLRAMFDRLAHASIMRLNAGSMDKVGVMVDGWCVRNEPEELWAPVLPGSKIFFVFLLKKYLHFRDFPTHLDKWHQFTNNSTNNCVSSLELVLFWKFVSVDVVLKWKKLLSSLRHELMSKAPNIFYVTVN